MAKPKYGGLSAPERDAALSRERWGRYDSPERTLYLANDLETAYAEVLSVFKRQLGAVDPLEKDAAALGIKREELLEIVSREWQESSFMGMGAIPRQWRADRMIYEVYAEGEGWLVDVEHPDTLSKLEELLSEVLVREEISTLTTAILRGENRRVTTEVGRLLRRVELDVESNARGIQFGSKFGGGWCRAIWLPDQRDDWSEDLIVLSGEQILVSDEHLARACERFRLHIF